MVSIGNTVRAMVLEWVRPGVVLLSATLTAANGGCASTYYDPLPPAQAQRTEVKASGRRSLETVYRQLYSRLDACYGSSYRVQPRFDRGRGDAWIMLVTGLGLNRYSLIGNRFEARVDMRETPNGVEVEVIHREPALDGLAREVERWLSGATDCSG